MVSKCSEDRVSVVSLDFNAEIITINKIKCLVVK